MSVQLVPRSLALAAVAALLAGLVAPAPAAAVAGPARSSPTGAPIVQPRHVPGTVPAPEPGAGVRDLRAGPRDLRAGLDGSGAGSGTDLPAPPGDGRSEPPPGVADDVLAAAAEGEVPVIIRLREQADLVAVAEDAAQAGLAAAAVTAREHGTGADELVRRADRAARAEVVVEALTSIAGRTQPQVRDLLTDHDAERVRDFWIFNGFAATVDEATLSALAGHPDVASVTLDQTITLDDPAPAGSGGDPILPSWALERVEAPAVWGEYGVRGAGVVVGVMDTGVDATHPALAGAWRGAEGGTETSWFAATGENYPEPGDANGHGTHVTGSIVGAPPGEAVGVAPGARWIAAKIFRDSGTTTDSIVHAGFEWMLAPGGDPAAAPDVVNNSWGSPDPHRLEFWDDVAAWVAAGIVPVFSNGNSGPGTGTLGSPASYPHAIGVGATDPADRPAWFSSRGPVMWDGVEYAKPQVSAPGYEVVSSLPGGGYGAASGTSMAAPHVTGVVALMLSAAPDLSIDEIRAALAATARAGSQVRALPDAYGAGIVDAHAAVTQVTRTGAVTGTVTGPDGDPVAARVSAAGRSATTGAETGGYALALPPGTHELMTTGYGHRTRTRTVVVTTGGTTTVDVTLDRAPEAALTGVVAGPEGPVPGARIAVTEAPLTPAHTDVDGGFRKAIAEGSYELRVTAAGYAPAVVPVTVEGETTVSVSLDPATGSPAPGWAQYQNNPAHTGLAGEPLAAESLHPDWTAEAGGDLAFSSPVIAGGRVFVNADDGRLVAFDLTDGARLWSFAGSTGMRGAPAVSGGVVYTGGGVDGGIHAVDAATGELRWRVPTPDRRTIYTAPVVVDGTVYATTGFTTGRSDTVFAIDAATGAVRWSTDIGASAFFGPAVADGLVVATSGDGLVALDADSGAVRWRLDRDDDLVAAPSIADGTVYAATSMPEAAPLAPGTRGSLLAVDAADGTQRWEAESHGDGQGTAPAVFGDLVIAGSHGLGTVAAYDRRTGEPVWHYGLEVTGGVSASVLVSGDGYVVGGAQLDERVFALDALTGELVWEEQLAAGVTSSPAYAEGRLVLADSDGTLRAYHPTGEVRGTVTGPDGPLPATVRLVGTDHQTEADEAGRFTLTGVPSGEYTVEASHFGYDRQAHPVRVLAARVSTVAVALEPVGEGGVAGTVRGEAGEPVPEATVGLSPTPLDPVETGPDGSFAFAGVAAGTYQLTVDAAGYGTGERTVTVAEGETVVADFTLARFDVAVVGDHEGRVTSALADAGWRVDEVTYAEIVDTTDRYRAVVLAGTSADRADADPDRFTRMVAAADAAGTSLIFLGTGGPSYGSVRTLSRVTGDPAVEDATLSNRGAVWLESVVPHPITASLPADRVPLLAAGSWHAWFSGYTGYTLATLGTDRDGRIGDGIGYQRRTLGSSHILLPAGAPSPRSTWEPAARDLLADAVAHGVAASYGAVTGQVTGPDGDPVPARVEVVGGFEHTEADADGSYRLLLEPGEVTLRFRFLGAQTVEVAVTVQEGAIVEQDLSLPAPELGVVAGRVTDADRGTPVAGAQVSLTGPEDRPAPPPATTGPDGRYVIEDVPAGDYRLEITASGFESFAREPVVVTDGRLTTVDATLPRAPGVVVVGDRDGEISGFLEAHSIPAEAAGWEVVDALAGVEVVILHNPPDLDRESFLAALDAFDAAGVSVIFPADGWATRTRGVDLLARHTGNPSGYQRIGGFNGPEILLHDPAEHPLFAGVPGDPVRLLTGSSEAAAFADYSGVVLAQVGEAGAEPAGIGIAYDARTPGSVHLLLTGLAATLRNSPGGNWTEDGQRIFLNAVRWAASPGLGGYAGTVTGPGGEPIPEAVVEVVGTGWRAVTDPGGAFEIGVPPGEYQVRYRAFGHVTAQRSLTVGPDQVVDASQVLVVGDVGSITGVVTSSEGGGLAGASVLLRGTPRRAVTGPDGSYALALVEPGSYELELAVDDHVRTIAAVEVTAGAAVRHDQVLRASPLVGVIDDSDYSNSRDRAKEFLRDWGYEVEDIGFDSVDRVPALDLVVANVSDFDLDPGPAGLAAFEEAVNRAGIPVLWLGQHERGAIQFLHHHQADPGAIGQGFGDGTVTASVVEDHPLVAGLPAEFPLIAEDGRYTWFDDFGGTTVATLATGEGGQVGDTIAYRGRTASTVDVLLSTLSVTTWGAPSTRQSPALGWSPEAERVLVNALSWALSAEGIGAEFRGTVQSDLGGRLPSRVEVVETGRTYQGREGDGTFLVPLPPGTWTLSVSAFGHQDTTIEVTVEAGDVAAELITLAAVPAGTITGTVTGPDGSPIAGARVSLPGTPLAVTTGSDGGYTVARVPAGDWTLRVTADGFRAQQVPAPVTAGQTSPVDVRLPATSRIALVDVGGTFGASLAALLTAEGYEAEVVLRGDLPALAAEVAGYDLVIFNSSLLSSQREGFRQAVDAAAGAGVSTIFASQFGGGSPIGELSAHRGDPAEVDWGFVPDGVDYVPTAAHPIFAGFPVGEPIPLLSNPGQNQQWGAYGGWSGETIAHLHARTDGRDLGAAVGFRFSSPTSVELLLGSLTATTHGWPDGRWTAPARQIYRNAVAWALDATQAQLTGVVTGGGEPLAGARVSAAEAIAVTGPDGSYTLGLPAGTHPVRVSAFGFADSEQLVTVPNAGVVTLDVDLAPLPRGEVSGVVRSASGDPVPGATVDGVAVDGAAVDGDTPLAWTATTGPDGRYVAADLLEGDYTVTVTAPGFLPATGMVTVTAGTPATLDLTLRATDVGVLGDHEGVLTAYLRDQGVPATELAWDAAPDLRRFQVVVVNGGSPGPAAFAATLAAADAAQVSLVFTGTWGVDRGGIRLLERHTDRVVVGEQGYGDGPVRLTGFDPGHPIFAGLGPDPAALIGDGGYYSVLGEYAGRPLADLRVARDGAAPVTGLAVGWDWRTAGSVEVLLSASAVTEAVGPDLGWTPEGGQLLVDAIAWARTQVLTAPAAPALVSDAPVVVTGTVRVSGEAPAAERVTVHRDGTPVATVAVAGDGAWSAEVHLVVGDNVLTATATNLAGDSPASAAVRVARWLPGWEVDDYSRLRLVTLSLDGPSRWVDPADRAELVVRDAAGEEVTRVSLRWVVGAYQAVVQVPAGGTVSAELVVADHLLVIDGPDLATSAAPGQVGHDARVAGIATPG